MKATTHSTPTNATTQYRHPLKSLDSIATIVICHRGQSRPGNLP
jgi:hypothetical protein